MMQLLEFSPLIVFFVVFKLFDIYWATAALMLACFLVMIVHRWRTGRFKPADTNGDDTNYGPRSTKFCHSNALSAQPIRP